jgi:hypothetical protein
MAARPCLSLAPFRAIISKKITKMVSITSRRTVRTSEMKDAVLAGMVLSSNKCSVVI